MEIKTFSPQDHFLKVLIYGPSKAGKTTFAGTAKDAVFASAEGGLLAIAKKKPQNAKIKTFKDLNEFYLFLASGKHKYKTVVIDSISEVNDIIKDEIEQRVGRTMQQQDWGEHTKKVIGLLRKFRDLPMNVIMIALEKYINDEEKIKKIVPQLDGKSATKIVQFMDTVAYLHVEPDGTRWIESETSHKLLTGDRSNVIGNDAPIDFEEWLKRAQSIEVGEEETVEEFTPSSVLSKKPIKGGVVTPKSEIVPQHGEVEAEQKPHLKALQKELIRRGAQNGFEGIQLLNESIGSSYKDFAMNEKEASTAFIKLLQVKYDAEQPEETKEEEKKVEKASKASYKSSIDFSDPEKAKKILSGLKTYSEIKGYSEEMAAAYEQGDLTKSVLTVLSELCARKFEACKK